MSKINKTNLQKAIQYFKRNGLRDTCLAALDRMKQSEDAHYTYEPPIPAVLEVQKQQILTKNSIRFSILVPAYQTPVEYLQAMIESVLAQSYSNFELIIADAGEENTLKEVIGTYQDKRIRYLPLEQNNGIAENTNVALREAEGDYIGLLDHDDLLTPDALFEIAAAISKAKEDGHVPRMLYSDEDKCSADGNVYEDPHYKTEFNLDLILSNNYICHFLILQARLMKELELRSGFDGAQDYDLVLRAVGHILEDLKPGEREKEICHIPKVLYHWRCHSGSTAANPGSKQYAYEAGRRAVADFLKQENIEAKVVDTKHLGFYRIQYGQGLLSVRKDVGAVGGRLTRNNKITGGIYDESGICPYEGLSVFFSGYMHRAVLQQDAHAVDIRRMQLRPELFSLAEDAAAELSIEWDKPILIKQINSYIDCKALMLTEEEYRKLSLRICEKVKEAGYRIVFDPLWKENKPQKVAE